MQGDYILNPAYELINTSLHVDDTAMALVDGLLKGKIPGRVLKPMIFVRMTTFMNSAGKSD